MVFLGSINVLAKEQISELYDAQARSLLHGHWDTPARPLSLERFTLDGRTYTYFGPWPAVLRMPVVAVTHSLDGRLSRVSMMIAFVVFLVFAARLTWQARTLLLGEAPPSRATLIAAGGYVFTAGCGSTALFLASRAWVYHEAILWAVAWSLGAFSFLVAYLVAPRARDLAWACVTATLAVMSRPSIGSGPVVVLAALLAMQIIRRVSLMWHEHRRARHSNPSVGRRLARWCGVSDTTLSQRLWPVALAIAIPVVIYAYVNYAKFGSLFGLPVDKQDILFRRPERRAALSVSHSLFSLRYAPSNLLQYLRPDAIGFDRLFPWVTFSSRPHIIGDVPYDNIEPSASILAVSTILIVLAALGAVAAIQAPRTAPGKPTAAALRLPILAAAVSTVGAVVLGVQFQRYEGDFVPALVLAGAVGLFWIPRLLDNRTRLARRFVVGALALLGVWSCWATFSLTLLYQRAYSGFQPTPIRAGFVSFQLDVNDALGFGGPQVSRGDRLPQVRGKEVRRTTAPLGRIFVLPYCTGVFLSNGKEWQPVEETLTGPTPICDRLLRAA
jgi:hypothetical protein